MIIIHDSASIKPAKKTSPLKFLDQISRKRRVYLREPKTVE